MRIAYLSKSRVPSRAANSVHVMKMCQAFQQEGHTPSLVAIGPPWSGPSRSNRLWADYGIARPFRLLRVPHWRLLRLGHLYLASALFARWGGFDLVYARNLGAAALSASMGIPTVFERHAPIESRRTESRQFRCLLCSPGFRHMVVITHALKDHFLENYPARLHDGNVVVAPDGVDLERFVDPIPAPRARVELGLSPRQFTVGYCGHLYPGRGIELIFELGRRMPKAAFLIAGGEEKDVRAYACRARSMGLDNLHFRGFVPHANVPVYLSASDVLLMPFQRRVQVSGGGGDTSRWMSPMKMFEYMAAGRLIVSSDLSVLREVLNSANAVLCPPEDVDAWQSTLTRAAADGPWREQLARQARRDVEQYTWRSRVRRVLGQTRPGEASQSIRLVSGGKAA